MSNAGEWLQSRTAKAPAQLQERMQLAIAESTGDSVHDHLAKAAALCLQSALQRPAHRASALDLLSADALLTHACGAAAAAGAAELKRFTESLDAARFEALHGEMNDRSA